MTGHLSPRHHVLITGMSGSGKSTVIAELVRRGFNAVDADEGYVDQHPDGRQDWNAERIESLLDSFAAQTLFVAGCEEGMVRFLARFDAVILLSAPWEVLAARVTHRTNNPFGTRPGDLERIRGDFLTVEPLLRGICTVEVDTTKSLSDTVETVLRHAT